MRGNIQLGSDEYLLSRDAGVTDSTTDLFLIPVEGSCVKVAIYFGLELSVYSLTGSNMVRDWECVSICVSGGGGGWIG